MERKCSANFEVITGSLPSTPLLAFARPLNQNHYWVYPTAISNRRTTFFADFMSCPSTIHNDRANGRFLVYL